MLAGASSNDGDKVFAGVRFVLFGFDSVSEAQCRSELVRRGGVDVGRYDQSCTHVIVSGRVYDDPVCVAARNDRKIVVTELWIEDSVDSAALTDPDKILYKPVRDLNGIPGSGSLLICLTGYQRQERENIMKMVDLMGAHFSKPLIAAKVTHLICYKFEGEKYELAKKVNIKLVNHRWLEDCLKAWEILPIENYRKSGWELEIMEAEARDSDEETGDSSVRKLDQRFITSQISGLPRTTPFSGESKPSGHSMEMFITRQEVTMPTKMPSHDSEDILVVNKLLSTPCKEGGSNRASDMFNGKVLGECSGQDGMGMIDMKETSHEDAPVTSMSTSNLNIESNKLTFDDAGNVSTHSDAGENKFNSLGYSRKKPGRSVSTKDILGSAGSFPGEFQGNDISMFSAKQVATDFPFTAFQSPPTSADLHRIGTHSGLPQKEEVTVPISGLVSPDSGYRNLGPSALEDPLPASTSVQLESPLHNDTTQGKTDLKNVRISSSGTAASLINQDSHLSKSSLLTRKKLKRNSASRANSTACSFDVQVADLFCNARNMDESCSFLPKKRKISHPSSGFENLKPDSSSNNDEIQRKHDYAGGNALKFSDGTAPASPMSDQGVHSSKSKSAAFEKKPVQHDDATVCSDIVGSFNGQVADLSCGDGATQPPGNQNRTEGLPNLASRCSDGDGTLPPIGCTWTNLELACNPVKVAHSKKRIRINVNALKAVPIDSEHASSVSPKCKIPKASILMASELYLQTDKGNVSATELLTVQSGTKKDGKLKDEILSGGSKDSGMRILSNIGNSRIYPKSSTKSLTKKVVAKKVLSCKRKLSVETSKERTSAYCDESVNPDKSTLRTEMVKETVFDKKDNDKNNEMNAIVSKDEAIGDFVEKGNNSAKECASSLEKAKAPIFTRTLDRMNEMVQSVSVDVVRQENMEKSYSVENNAENVTIAANRMSSCADEENKPEQSVLVTVKTDKHGSMDMSVKSGRKVRQRNKRIDKATNGEQQRHQLPKAISEPAWFILSGHRLQRKEFRTIIRRLRGRLCSDSHHWSYRATHFIVPEPVRRTEKFFAAAASGRWILKMDYLTASNEAGKLLDEEPFEWHASGFSQDAAINLEAPRRWRLLRERTGHGAFYGMQIIIHGDCIAPPMDTLKRVVKAGDGTILATCPPYTRFLKLGVDFAVLGQDMTDADSWIQEFLRHEIPCVTADYLVEYVCKLGCSLDKYVCFDTHAWARKSLASLRSRSEEIVTSDDSRPHSEDPDDICCIVCGSRDRGEVMLICGDERGSAGCGIGTHIDCCDPPLDAVPDEDWFCPKCTQRKVGKAPAKGRRKR